MRLSGSLRRTSGTPSSSSFTPRMILVDMWAEYAGIYIGSLVLFLGQRMPLFYSFRPYRKHP
jgi:hypothetical protein